MVDKDQHGKPLKRPFAPDTDTDYNPIPKIEDLVRVKIVKDGDDRYNIEKTDTGRPIVKDK